jgi:hypothetical protein
MPLDDAGLIAASRTFAARLLAHDDDPARIAMGLLAIVSQLGRSDPTSWLLIAIALRNAAAAMEDGQRLN